MRQYGTLAKLSIREQYLNGMVKWLRVQWLQGRLCVQQYYGMLDGSTFQSATRRAIQEKALLLSFYCVILE